MCPLCHSPNAAALPVAADQQRYFHCDQCDLRFLDPVQRLSPLEEKRRYGEHRTHLADEGYHTFVNGLLVAVQEQVPKGGRVLDYGAGHQPVLAQWMRDLGYEVTAYDPFFWPEEPSGLFDAVVSCEVIEHFFDPAGEFLKMRDWLRDTGCLVAMTDIYRPNIDFLNWYYRRDPTHVVFYSEQTLHWIGQSLGFTKTDIRGRVACFTR